MKLNLGKRNKGKRRCQISVKCQQSQKRIGRRILKANPEYKSWEHYLTWL